MWLWTTYQNSNIYRPQKKSPSNSLPEFYGQRDGVDECIDLENTDEEEAEVLKHLREEIPEDADVGGQVRHTEAGIKTQDISDYHFHV